MPVAEWSDSDAPAWIPPAGARALALKLTGKPGELCVMRFDGAGWREVPSNARERRAMWKLRHDTRRRYRRAIHPARARRILARRYCLKTMVIKLGGGP